MTHISFIKAMFFVVGLWLISSSAFADIYKCIQPDGKIKYQEAPCAIGAQKVIDDTDSKRRIAREDSVKKSKEMEIKQKEMEKKTIDMIRLCYTKKTECDPDTYRRSLVCLSAFEVEDILGEPTRTQNIAGGNIIYYSVPVHNGKRFSTAKLQLIMGRFCGDRMYGLEVVKEVNVY